MNEPKHPAAAGTYFAGIQSLRGIAAVLVVLYHLVNAEVIYGRGSRILDGLPRFGFAGVDVFFVISGFVMVTIASDRFGSLKNAGAFLARRAARILPLYWLYTTLIVAMLVIAPHALSAEYHGKSILASYLLLPQTEHPLLQVGWTLIYEAFFYLMMAAAIACLRPRYAVTFLIGWAGAVLLLQFAHASAPWQLLITSPMAWEFIAGGLIGLYWPLLPRRAALATCALGAIAFVVAAAILSGRDIVGQDPMRRTLVFGSCSALIVLGLAAHDRGLDRAGRAFMRSIGDASYSIYLSHLFVITVAARAWGASGLNTTAFEHFAFVALALIASVGFGLISYRLIERPLLSLTGAFMRRRTRLAAELTGP